MYLPFTINDVETDYKKRTITVHFSHDIDPDTVNHQTVLLGGSDGSVLHYKLQTSRNKVFVLLTDWPEPSRKYLLRIGKQVTSIVGDELSAAATFTIQFQTEITSTVRITTPANFETIKGDEVTVRWEEVPSDGAAAQQTSSEYVVEVSKENSFYNVLYSTTVQNKNDITFADLEGGQYFVRVRAVRDGLYGPWSETVTFMLKDGTLSGPDDELPVFIDGLEIVEVIPRSGETPESFVICFSDDIDPNIEIENIIIKRRPI